MQELKRSSVAAFLCVAALLASRAGATDPPPVDVADLKPLVSAADVAAAAPVAVYDRQAALYGAALEVARALALSRSGERTRDVVLRGLDPPKRPRLDLPLAGAPRLGSAEAPVTVVAVESLASGSAKPVDLRLRAARRRFGESVSVVHLDFLLEVPRALELAVAGRCAHRQGAFWRYRDAMLVAGGATSERRLRRHAGAVGLRRGEFDACLADGAIAEAAREVDSAVRRAGVVTAPSLFVNGVYVAGNESVAAFLSVVEEAMPGPEAADSAALSALPWRYASLVGGGPTLARALLLSTDGSRRRLVAEGDRIAVDALVERIDPAFVLVDRPGGKERLPLVPGLVLVEDLKPEEMSDRALVTRNVDVVVLDDALRGLVEQRRRRLEEQFSAAPLPVDGERLLKLTGERQRRLLARLGLESGDVLMRLDGEWVLAGSNPLFERLAGGGATSLVIMRRGIPRLLDYRP